MNKEQKAEQTREIKDLLDDAGAIYLTDFKGITVEQVNEIRRDFAKANIKYRVVKNTLVTRALRESNKFNGFDEKLSEHLKGTTGVIFSGDEVGEPAKILKKYFDKIERPKLKAAVIESEIYDSKRLNELASLPSKTDLIASILGSLNSPASGIVGTLNALMRDLGSVIEEAAKSREGQAA